jgi:hypothetical protein
MANIFLTGTSATYASPSASERSLSFAGVLNKVLTLTGNTVTWGSPSVFMEAEDYKDYDSVLVGLSALTSLNSDRAYGALNLINKLWGSDKLVIFVDTPSPSQIEVSLNAISTNPESLTKPFFSFRKDFQTVATEPVIKKSILSAVELLKNEDWGPTIYSKLPWKQQNDIKILRNAKAKITGINLDSFLIEDSLPSEDLSQRWVIDTEKTKWAKSVTSTLSLPVSPMKWDRGWTDLMVYENIRKSWGALISPENKDGTWWNYRYIQALNAGTPVATYWPDSRFMGEVWSMLPSSLESISLERRNLIALAQKETYLAYIPSRERAVYELIQTLNIKEPLWAK